ncbi:MAG: hypothetical protein ACOVLE_10535 [Pirellula staleyi]
MNVLNIPLPQQCELGQLQGAREIMRDMKRAVLAELARWQSVRVSIFIYLLIVASVAVYDFVLTIKYSSMLQFMEENPVGRWLMGLDKLSRDFGETPDLTLFLTLKTIGTLTVLATMYLLFRWRSRIGHPVALGVSSYQIYLAGYLTFALPME